ncbi:CPBP family intramembrane glutamic endopeptidase [Haloimpatiens sp. FM7315]|uniref:CPBP family intramembrane glutamic endopeptidase n=1 Tax=Haloimpatiens sp. FM7315 TaxID=3298609 RepID=UPI0035A30F9C
MENKIKKANIFTMSLVLMNVLCSVLLAPVAKKLNLGMYGIMAIANLFMLVVPLAIYILKSKESLKNLLSLKPINGKSIAIVVLIAIFIQPLMNYISGVMAFFLPNNVGELLAKSSDTPLYFKLIVVAVMPAILEELCMRGVVLSNYKGLGIKKAALITGLLFGLLHMNLQMLVYTFILGVVFAYLVYITKSIFSSMIPHFIINGTQVIIASMGAKIASTGDKAVNGVNSLGFKIGFIIGGALVALISFLIVRYLIRKLAVINGVDLKNLKNEKNYDLRDENSYDENNCKTEIVASKENKVKILDASFIVILVVYFAINAFSLYNIFK